MPTTLVPSINPTVAAIRQFADLRIRAYELLIEASKVPGLPLLYVKQAEAAAGIAGIALHRVHGQATRDDALALIADLEVIARKVDPLIAAIGDVAFEEFRVNDRQFQDVLANALHDTAIDELSTAAQRAEADAEEDRGDARHPGSHRAAMAREA